MTGKFTISFIAPEFDCYSNSWQFYALTTLPSGKMICVEGPDYDRAISRLVERIKKIPSPYTMAVEIPPDKEIEIKEGE